MTEEMKYPVNTLTAEELLKNRGIKYHAWDEYERSIKTLPKTGMKQFEPNNSWLQNMQLKKGIMTRKNLIAVERVERISQLANAEWLPTQKKAKVKKYRGQDWSSFGLEKNGSLYLIPEEALFLLEANCLELTWNDVPLSIQQAYDLLIDNIECSLEEYRVYSQLIRHGYHIQRFVYQSERNTKYDESINAKRKVIIEPENGRWMTDFQEQSKDTTDEKLVDRIEETDSSIEATPNVTERDEIINDVHEVLDNLLNAIENDKVRSNSSKCENDIENCIKSNINLKTANTNENKKNSKAEIISEETLLGNITIVNPTNDCPKDDKMLWRASRIQRNVKLLPKRTDKVLPTTDVSVIDSNTNKNLEHCVGKHKSPSLLKSDSQIKRSKQEIIELSDDEIQEVPKPMTRMEILNLIPNIASQFTITIKISRGYIPHSIRPHKTVYNYESVKLRNLQQTDKRLQSNRNVERSNTNQNRVIPYSDRRNQHLPFNKNTTTSIQNVFMQDYFSMEQGQYTNFNTNYGCINRMPYVYNQNSYWHHRNTVFHNMFLTVENHSTAVHQNRFMSVQTNNFLLPTITNNAIRSSVTQNQLFYHFYQNFLPIRKLYHCKITENMSFHCSVGGNVFFEPRQGYWSRNHHHWGSNMVATKRNNEVYQSSFKVLPGSSSWSELKAKWREYKTITIDDEDTDKDKIEEGNEVQIVETRSPLIGPKNANSLEEIFSKLKIIKSAPEKTVRRRKSNYKISYDVYSNTQNYRKANPGPPIYRIVVVRQDDPFIQPVELHRLLQDAGNSPIVLACVSMSITYVQPGFVSVHNLT